MENREPDYAGDEERKRDSSRKRDGKRDKKEKGYTVFEEEDSDDEKIVTAEEIKSPTKTKKEKVKPTFKFPVRKEKGKEKEEKKDKESKKEEKEKKKEEKEGKKHKKEKKKKLIHREAAPTVTLPSQYENPIFGVPLALAVERNKSHDGIELPAIFRQCIDYIEEYGLACEGIYRISGVKSKVQHLKDAINRHEPVYLWEHEPNIVASLLKQFLRDLPEPVLTTSLMSKFEESSVIKSNKKKVESFSRLIADLPTCNRLLLSWMIVHMTHVIDLAKENKMTLQNVSIVLSPTMQISHRVLNVLFSNAADLFGDVSIRRYVPPLKPAHSKWSLELPDNTIALEEELSKQESLLNQLHADLNSGLTDPIIEEQLWEVQRVVTQLKRKIKMAKKSNESGDRSRLSADPKKSSSTSLPSLSAPEELDLRPAPVPQANTTTVSVVVEKPPTDQEMTTDRAENDETKENQTEVASTVEDDDVKKSRKSTEIKAPEPVATLETKEVVIPQTEKVQTEKQEESTDAHEDRQTEEKQPVEKVEKELEKTEHADDNPDTTQEVNKNVESENLESETKEIEEHSKEIKRITSTIEEENVSETPVKDKSETDNEVEDSFIKSKPVKKVSDGSIYPPFMSMTPLEPVKAKVVVKQKEQEPESDFETLRKTEELRELEQELLGGKKKKVVIIDTPMVREPDSPQQEEDDSEDEKPFSDYTTDEEYNKLIDDQYFLKLEEEELLTIADELRQKIATERSEMERLTQEITELQYLRQDSDLEDLSFDSNSSDDSEDEDDLQEILTQLIQENQDMEANTADLCQKIHEERMICLSVKLQIRLLQQRQLETPSG